MKTILDLACYERMLTRFRGLSPEAPARWGQMNAPKMLAHLCDQMRHTLGDAPVTPHRTMLHWPPLKQIVMYWLPWPKGKIKGPPEAFLTPPTSWSADLATFESLLARFVGQGAQVEWAEHPFFGRMTHRSWGRFCHRHFDHHLRQFGA